LKRAGIPREYRWMMVDLIVENGRIHTGDPEAPVVGVVAVLGLHRDEPARRGLRTVPSRCWRPW